MDGLNIRKLYGKKISLVRNNRAKGKNKEVSNGISIRNLSIQALPISHSAAKKLIRKIFQCLRLSKQPIFSPDKCLIGMVFLNDTRIMALNQKYLKANRPTDVLVFNYGQNTADLAISLESAKRNAEFYRTSLQKELIRCIIHGILHLYGYDDRNPIEKKIMFKRQEEIFKKIASR